MSSIRLSIILPFYNVEKYIANCLDSIYNQNIPQEAYEVICVNDCSTDNSKDIILRYKKKYNNLILVEHKQNKMLGEARNTGLKVAKGKYVWFIDSDDFIKFNIFSLLLEQAETNTVDILHFNANIITEEGICLDYFHYNDLTERIIYGIDYLKSSTKTSSYWINNTWCKLFRKDFLISNKLYFPSGVYYEDAVHTLKSFLLTKRVFFLPVVAYYYRKNETSIMNTTTNRGLKLASLVILYFELIQTMANLCEESDFRNKWISGYYYMLNTTKKKVFFLNKKELEIFYNTLDYRLHINRNHIQEKTLQFYTSHNIRILLYLSSPFLVFFKSVKNRIKHLISK